MRNTIVLLILSACTFLANSNPYLGNDDIQSPEIDQIFNIPNSKGGFDLILTLLPVYGWVKVSYVLKPRSIDQIMVYKNLIFLNIFKIW